MARTNSTYTASPTRWRSPHRSPARRSASAEGSQYEMDLDALGMNSTFNSSEMSGKNEPKVDAVDTSDIEGPEDFTMNMTYWMTAELPLAQQIRSRKEAHVNISEVRGDAQDGSEEAQDTTAEGNKAVSEDSSRNRNASAKLNSESPATQANRVAVEHLGNKSPSEVSMENDEKVRSYLSALPDTDIGEDAITSTPLRIPRQNMLQVPSPGASKARSLQATVEDYDTPRKPTQETVIHHPHERIVEAERDDLLKKVVNLQSRLERQELASKTRNTELETVLAYTRSDLEAARNEIYKQKEKIQLTEHEKGQGEKNLEAARSLGESRLKAQEAELHTRMQEFGEELRLQNLAKVQSLREGFERQIRELEEAKRAAEDSMTEQVRLVEQHKRELSHLQQSHQQEIQTMKDTGLAGHPGKEQKSLKERMDLLEKLSSLQSRADSLQTGLEKATTEAKSAREDARAKATLHASIQMINQAQASRVSDLESSLESLQSQLASARAEVHAKDQLLQDAGDLQPHLQSLQDQLNKLRAEVTTKDQQLQQRLDLESRLQSLQVQLESAQFNAVEKDKHMLQQIEDQEGYDQRLSTAQGRILSLEGALATLRQQLAEAHRENAKAKSDVEQVENNLGDATDLFKDARAEADRRIADMEKKLAKLKEAKLEAESKARELQSQQDELTGDHDDRIESVREKAEDAVRKAGFLLEQERREKKRIAKELKNTSHDLEKLRTEVAQRATEEEGSSADENSMLSSSHPDAKDTEIENLRTLIRKQASTLKALKSESTILRKDNTKFKDTAASRETIAALQSQLTSLHDENTTLKALVVTREADFEAINSAMDERLAAMLSKMVKERTRNVVGKRDGQWLECTGEKAKERELMGRVLLREWGRQEVGAAREGDQQEYRYKYVERS